MFKQLTAASLCAGFLIDCVAQARTHRVPTFVHGLTLDGSLSTGRIHVLPGLATACSLRIDNRELTRRLVALSHETDNASYTADLDSALDRTENHGSGNRFDRAWNARCKGRQAEACTVVTSLWGEDGRQFPGVLQGDGSGTAANDASSLTVNDCG